MEGNALEEKNSEVEDWFETRGLREEQWFKRYVSDDKDWLEKSRLREENWKMLCLDEQLIEEHGFVFEKKTVTKQKCVVEIVIIGKGNCGKTQLIESVFGDHPSLTVTNRETRDEYLIQLSENASFLIWIYDVKDIVFVKKTNFRYKTVFLFCYAVDDPESLANLQEIWIPQFLQRCMIRMLSFVVFIQHDLKAQPKSVTQMNNLEQTMAVRRKAAALCRLLHVGRLIGCSTADKNSMVNIFQSAFDAVYSRVWQ